MTAHLAVGEIENVSAADGLLETLAEWATHLDAKVCNSGYRSTRWQGQGRRVWRGRGTGVLAMGGQALEGRQHGGAFEEPPKGS